MSGQEKFDLERLLQNTLKKLEVRKTDYFIELLQSGLDRNLKQFDKDKTDYQLECEGYGLFRPDGVLKEFFSYLERFVQFVKESQKVIIHSIKIQLNGFKFDQKTKYLETLVSYILKISQNITTLWIYTTDLENVTLEQYKQLFLLMNGLGKSNNENFQSFVLQCANWKFQSSQPSFKELEVVFANIFEGKVDENGNRQQLSDSLKQRYVRIQLSGWWFQEQDALIFLGIQNQFNQIDKQNKEDRKNLLANKVNLFHLKMIRLTSMLLEVMDNIETLEIDMRNNHQYMQMKKLKQKILCGVTKNGRQEKSLISIRGAKNSSKQQESRRLRLSIVM